MFGWSYPPGAANDPNAPWNQEDGPCAVCACDCADCICPECPTCGQMGDPDCYKKHGLKLTREQSITRQKARVYAAKERLQDAELALAYLEEGGDVYEEVGEDTDPWR